MSRFLITGLPRSRTAWWAVATGALHEPISHAGGYRKFRPLWSEGRGVSDSGAALYLTDILREMKPRTLIVERPIGEVMTSFLAYAGHRVQIDRQALARTLWSARRYLDAVDDPLIKRVGFDELEDLDTLKAAFDWLGVEPPNDLEQLAHMRIESDLGWNMQALAKLRGAA